MKKLQYRMHRANSCGGIETGGNYDCANPIVAGVSQRLILINKSDLDKATIVYDNTNSYIITDIVLTGAIGFAFEGIRKSINPQTAYVPTSLSSGYDHQVEFLVFDISAEQKINIEKMALSTGLVAIVENVNAIGNANSVFEIFGLNAGMVLQAGPMRINGDTETNSAYTLNLKTSDDYGKEPHLPTSWWDTDYVTTKTRVDALLGVTP